MSALLSSVFGSAGVRTDVTGTPPCHRRAQGKWENVSPKKKTIYIYIYIYIGYIYKYIYKGYIYISFFEIGNRGKPLKTSNLVMLTSLEHVSSFQLSRVRSLQSSALAGTEPMTATYVVLTEVWGPRIFELSLFSFFSNRFKKTFTMQETQVIWD